MEASKNILFFSVLVTAGVVGSRNFAHPASCTKYITCLALALGPIELLESDETCAPDTVFDDTVNDCVQTSMASKESLCVPAGAATGTE